MKLMKLLFSLLLSLSLLSLVFTARTVFKSNPAPKISLQPRSATSKGGSLYVLEDKIKLTHVPIKAEEQGPDIILNKLEMNYTAAFDPLKCIKLQNVPEVTAVQCSKGQLVLTCANAAALATVQSWTAGTVISGGDRFQCATEADGILKKVIKITVNASTKKATISVSDARFQDCYQSMQGKLAIHHKQAVTVQNTKPQYANPPKRPAPASIQSAASSSTVKSDKKLATVEDQVDSKKKLMDAHGDGANYFSLYFVEPVLTGNYFSIPKGSVVTLGWNVLSRLPDPKKPVKWELWQWITAASDVKVGHFKASSVIRSLTSVTLNLGEIYTCSDEKCAPIAAPESVNPYYIRLNYDNSVHWYTWCEVPPSNCYDNAPHFMIPVTKTYAFNYQEATNSAIAPLSLFDFDCSKCPLSFPDLSFACRLCTDNNKLNFSLTCTNCYVKYEYTITYLEFDMNMGFDFAYALKVNGSASAAVDLLFKLGFKFSYEGSKQLIKGIPLARLGFHIGGLALNLDMTFAVDLIYNLGLDLQGEISAGVYGDVIFNAESYRNWPPGSTNSKSIMTTEFRNVQYSPIVASLQADVSIEVGLRPTLSVDFYGAIGSSSDHPLIHAGISADIYVGAYGKFSYPAFPAIAPPNSYDLDPTKVSPFHFGDCTRNHYIRYQISYGIKNVKLSGYIKISLPVIPNVDYSFEYIAPIHLGPFPLLSGCALQVDPALPSFQEARVTMNFQKAFNFGVVGTSSITSDLALLYMDLANILNIPSSRLRYSGSVDGKADTALVDILPAGADSVRSSNLVNVYYNASNFGDSKLVQGAITRFVSLPNICPSGARKINGRFCALCAAGTYCSLGVFLNVVSGPCDAGYYCPAGSTNAKAYTCPKGTFSSAGQVSNCTSCNSGFTTSGTATAFQSSGSQCSTRTKCTWGQYLNANGQCASCRAGYYGRSDAATVNNDQCSGPCQAGYFCPAGSSSPTANVCPTGTYSTPGSSSCIICSVLAGQPAGATSCSVSPGIIIGGGALQESDENSENTNQMEYIIISCSIFGALILLASVYFFYVRKSSEEPAIVSNTETVTMPPVSKSSAVFMHARGPSKRIIQMLPETHSS